MIAEYVKVIGFKFDALEGINIVQDANRQTIMDAARFADKHNDHNTIWLAIPCKLTINETLVN